MTRPIDRAAAQRARWTEDTSSQAGWDAAEVLRDLRKAGSLEEALRFGTEALQHWPDLDPLRTALAWVHYSRDLAGLDEHSDRATRAAGRDAVETIRTLCAADPYGRFSVWPQAVLKLAGVLAAWPDAQLTVLEALDPAELSTERNAEFPSHQERWYLLATKAAKQAKRWDVLEARTSEALDADWCTGKERGWMLHRRATAVGHLGDPHGAVEVLETCRPVLNEWWVDQDLAQWYELAGDTDTAIDCARRALAAPGAGLDMRIRTVVRLAGLLAAIEDEHADAHLQLARWIRHDQGWPPSKDLEAAAADRSLPEVTARPDLAVLRATWRAAPDPDREEGQVTRLLPGEGSGFLTREAGGDLYFSMRRGTTAPPVGTRVSFRVVDGFDRARNRPSKKAVDVEVAAPPSEQP